MLAGVGLLLALLEHRLHDERVELLLVRVAREGGRALQAARPRLDVLEVLRAVERVENELASGERVLAARELLEERAPDLHGRVVDAVVVVLAALAEEELGQRRIARIELRVELEGLRELLVRLGLLERASLVTYALLLPRLELGEAHLLERGDRVVNSVVALRLQRLAFSLFLGHAARCGHVLGRGVVALVEVVEVDLAQIIVNLVRALLALELREVDEIEARRALELGAARLVLLRLGVELESVLLELLLDLRARAGDDGQIALRLRPRGAGGVARDGAIVRGAKLRPLLDRVVALRDLEDPGAGVGARGLELEEQLVGLDPAVVVGLIVELHGEGAHDLAGEAVAADLGEEAVDVLRGVLLVLGEDLDEILERLRLELVELLALRGVRLGPT